MAGHLTGGAVGKYPQGRFCAGTGRDYSGRYLRGHFSPTEAAGIACVAAVIIASMVYRDLDWRDVLTCAEKQPFNRSGDDYCSRSRRFSWVLTINQVPQEIAGWIAQANLSPWVLLLIINVALLLLGAILDPIAAILVVTPLLAPIMAAAGVDLVHLGIIMTLNLAIGLLTPPFGLSLFITQGALGLRLGLILRGVIPVLIVQLLALAIVTFIPELSTALPNFLFARA
ncbi:TRAP transporter large permease subunit [Aliamphritea spongicola]|nr:TRAP transporter large permease subunit [Aliamphritea spongicola]